ncbi:hypothetical protein L9F63_010472, partial [Diploptera punctata]
VPEIQSECKHAHPKRLSQQIELHFHMNSTTAHCCNETLMLELLSVSIDYDPVVIFLTLCKCNNNIKLDDLEYNRDR